MAKKKLFSRPVKKQTMAEQMAESIKELILSGELEEGAALPTEPELAEYFSVSRAVVRDATRILMALGLVEVRHGAGVFVTPIQNEAFGEALLLALRRAGATVWDVEHFDLIIFPEMAALAAAMATDEEIAKIRRLVDECVAIMSEHYTNWGGVDSVPPAELEKLRTASWGVMFALFEATHNRVFQQLARPLLNLRSLRTWQDRPDDTPERATQREADYLRQMVDAVATRDPNQARTVVTRLMQLPPEAIEAMRQTPVGERPQIPVPLPK
jgi:DNA-binding FadR family transcriptional regulator